MKRAFLLLAVAASGGAQWRHFGEEGRPGAAPSSLARQMVAAHNAVRARVGVGPLVWSERLAARAQDWADTLLARKQFFHRPNNPLGENLYEITGAQAPPAEVVADWADEARDYNYASNSCRRVCGHYTQIVWAGSKSVGCAAARGGRVEIWVCNYDPPGNWAGKRPY